MTMPLTFGDPVYLGRDRMDNFLSLTGRPPLGGDGGLVLVRWMDALGDLVALHSDFDWLIIARSEFWQVGGVDGESDGSGDAGLSCDEAGFFER